MSAHLEWRFPLPRPYTGILLGNGRMGVMVWGCEDLHLTFAQNGFWDRRGGNAFSTRTDYQRLRRLVEADDGNALAAIFASDGPQLGFDRPTQLPGGRLDLGFGHRPVRAELDPRRGRLSILFANGVQIEVRQSMTSDVLMVSAAPCSIRLNPAWNWIAASLREGDVAAPEEWQDSKCGGFVQRLPQDPGFGAEWSLWSEGLLLATAVSPDPARTTASLLRDFTPDLDSEHAWWDDYYRDVPEVSLPDPALQRVWDYGIFQQAGLTAPDGVAATLQGAWMAESALPLWSNDYHFNINLQMIYGPALPTNREEHLRPLWRLFKAWLPALKANAAKFFGCQDALMLPHAVDDRCQVIGQFWQGTIDQACTAWMAQMAWMHYRHSMDEEILREVAWPLLVGAFEGFWAMAEDHDDRLSLPLSVSAEYPGWGRDASFQLAAFHMVADLLPRAAGVLGVEEDPRWQDVRRRLPRATTMHVAKVWGEAEPRPRIVLWQGQDLDESHRHHSHLAAISPFHTIDPVAADGPLRDLVRRSIDHWTTMGTGQWTGWSVPWAAMIWARCNYASAAVTLLRVWQDVFTNEGGQSLHDADSPGFSSWLHGPFFDWPETERQVDKMQMDASMGALQAMCEIFVQQRGDTLHILPSLPKQWQTFSFEGVLCEGAFLVSAWVEEGILVRVTVLSKVGGPLRVAFPSPLYHRGSSAHVSSLETAAGERLEFVLEQTPQ